MSDLIREINEEIQADKLAALWKQFQTPLIVGAVTLVIGTGVFSVWNARQTEIYGKATDQLIRAMDSKDVPAALIEAGQQKDTLAVTRILAASETAVKNPTQAITLYAALVDDQSLPAGIRNRAILDMVGLQINHDKNFDAARAYALLETITSAKNDRAVFAPEAHILAGLIAQSKLQKKEEAQAHFDAVLKDETAPEGMKDRARALINNPA